MASISGRTKHRRVRYPEWHVRWNGPSTNNTQNTKDKNNTKGSGTQPQPEQGDSKKPGNNNNQ